MVLSLVHVLLLQKVHEQGLPACLLWPSCLGNANLFVILPCWQHVVAEQSSIVGAECGHLMQACTFNPELVAAVRAAEGRAMKAARLSSRSDTSGGRRDWSHSAASFGMLTPQQSFLTVSPSCQVVACLLPWGPTHQVMLAKLGSIAAADMHKSLCVLSCALQQELCLQHDVAHRRHTASSPLLT